MKRLIAILLTGALAPLLAGAASAQEVRIARQFSMGYLQFNVMEHEKLLEKHAAALGLKDVKIAWSIFNGPDAMNNALISDSIDIVAGGTPGRVAVPTVKVSLQAVLLQMAAAKMHGPANYGKYDALTVSMSPPDATIALMTGSADITCVFSVPPFQQQQLEKPGIRTILNSFEVMDGPSTFTVAWTSARFRDKNPVLYRALIAALKEATDSVDKDRKKAAGYWIEDVKSKLPLDKVTAVISGPQVRWTMTPENTMKFATFMASVGSLKEAPKSWKDMFFPEVHDLNGS